MKCFIGHKLVFPNWVKLWARKKLKPKPQNPCSTYWSHTENEYNKPKNFKSYFLHSNGTKKINVSLKSCKLSEQQRQQHQQNHFSHHISHCSVVVFFRVVVHKVILATLFLSFSIGAVYGNHVCFAAQTHMHCTQASQLYGSVDSVICCYTLHVCCVFVCIALVLCRMNSHKAKQDTAKQSKAMTYQIGCMMSLLEACYLNGHVRIAATALNSHCLCLSSETIKNYWVSSSSTCFTI